MRINCFSYIIFYLVTKQSLISKGGFKILPGWVGLKENFVKLFFLENRFLKKITFAPFPTLKKLKPKFLACLSRNCIGYFCSSLNFKTGDWISKHTLKKINYGSL